MIILSQSSAYFSPSYTIGLVWSQEAVFLCVAYCFDILEENLKITLLDKTAFLKKTVALILTSK